MSHSDGVHPPLQGGAKKLRFDDEVTKSPAVSDVAVSGCASGRSALKGSPNISSPPLFASSLRRPSEAASSHGDVHVQLNPYPEVIQHDGSASALAAGNHPLPSVAEPAGEVANFLANVGAGITNGFSAGSFSVASVPTVSVGSPNGSAAVMMGNASSNSDTAGACSSAGPDASDRFRTLLLQLSALILEHRPKDPEQYIVDHLNARLLSASALTRAPMNDLSGTGSAGGAADGSAHHHHDDDGETCSAVPLLATDTAAVFQPFGDTVVERLASNALSTEVGHTVLARIAEQLISTQPDDPEDFLWARLEARSFGEEAAHNLTVNANGYPVVRPEDPAQLALLKDIPTSSPGYVIAVNLLPALFAKKPADPISYLFYHIGSRTRSSAAPSVHSSTRPLRVGSGAVDEEDDFPAESCTSREFGEDSYSGNEDGTEVVSVSESANQLPLQRKGSLGSLFDAAAAAASSTNSGAQSTRRPTAAAAAAGERSTSSRHRASTHGLTSSRASSGRRSVGIPVTSVAPTSRSSKEATISIVSGPDELAALYNSNAKRVSIAQQEVQPPSPSHFSYDSTALPGGNVGNSSLAGAPRSHRDSTSTAEPRAWNGPTLSASGGGGLPHGGNSGAGALWRMEADEHARIQQDFELLRVREELRLERLQHEIRTLARDCEYRTRIAVLNKTDRMADRAAAAAREALEEAHIYRGFLCAQLDQLEGEQQRQMRLLSQQVARMASPGIGGVGAALPSPSVASWLGEEAMYRQADPRDGVGSGSSYGCPSELDILKKQVELLTMEQARAKHCGYVSAAPSRYRAPGMSLPPPNCRSPHPMQ